MESQHIWSHQNHCRALLLLPAQVFHRVAQEEAWTIFNINQSLVLLLFWAVLCPPPPTFLLICSSGDPPSPPQPPPPLSSTQIHLDIPGPIWPSSLCFSLSPPPSPLLLSLHPSISTSICLSSLFTPEGCSSIFFSKQNALALPWG